MFFDNTRLDTTKLTFKWAQINQKIYTHISTDSNYCWFLDSKLKWIVFLLQETTRCFVPVAVFFTILRFKTSSFIILFLAIISKQIIAYSSLLVNFKMISNLVFMKMVSRKKLVFFQNTFIMNYRKLLTWLSFPIWRVNHKRFWPFNTKWPTPYISQKRRRSVW